MRLPLPAALLLAASLAGCVAISPRTDAAFGKAVREARTLQTLNPEAGRDDPTLPTPDAASSRNALAQQRDSFKRPAQSNVQILNFGGAKSGGDQ